MFGTLTVTPVTDEVVTITGNSGTELYDGAEETVTGYVVTNISNLLYTGADFVQRHGREWHECGVYNMELSLKTSRTTAPTSRTHLCDC